MLDTLAGWLDGFWSGAGYVVIVAAVLAETPRLLPGVTEGSGEALMTLVDPHSDAHLAVADVDLRQFGMWLLQYVL
ncbi:MAG: hypothetical protein PHW25_21000 [Zoogloea sp.]|uniref:hypothetical protein n=1 Tax=Zoogloea sp. TaxID=49181 RepID=UPI00262953BF|nr:hypothetical protein [Zoogloea sp.]MDD3329565.1 hypothetical protein [Zoogloea sp.]